MTSALGYELVESSAGKLRVWDEPLPNKDYVLGADVAENRVRDRALTKGKPGTLRDKPDYSCAIVIDMEDGQHVATWHGHIDPTEFAITCAAVGLYYNRALLVPEVNSAGVAVVEMLTKVIQYQPLYRSKLFNRVDIDDPLGTEWGWRTSESTRAILMAQIQQAVNYGTLFTRDQHLMDELRTLQYDEQGKPRGIGRDKDDRVFALGLALMGRSDHLTGRLSGVQEAKDASRLSADDQLTWRRVKKLQQRIRSARSNTGSRGALARLDPIPRLTR